MKKMFYIGAALLTGAMGLTAFYSEKPEDMINGKYQALVDEFNEAKQAECDATILAAATVKTDSMIAAIPVAVPGKGGKTLATKGKKPTTKPANTKGGTSAGTPVTPAPPIVPVKPDPKKDKMQQSNGQIPESSTTKKVEKMQQSNGQVPESSTTKKVDKMKKVGTGGGGL